MNPKVTVYVAQSLDGYIARSDGAVDWLNQWETPDGTDYGFKALMDSIDVLVMGRHTFEQVLSFGVDWPYGEKRVVVLSSASLDIPHELDQTVSNMSGEPAEILERLASEGARHLYVDGGVTIQAFLTAGAVDELILTTLPVLIGAGISLFGALERDVALDHVATEAFANGLVQSTYRVAG